MPKRKAGLKENYEVFRLKKSLEDYQEGFRLRKRDNLDGFRLKKSANPLDQVSFLF
jgi:hypothetical protein